MQTSRPVENLRVQFGPSVFSQAVDSVGWRSPRCHRVKDHNLVMFINGLFLSLSAFVVVSTGVHQGFAAQIEVCVGHQIYSKNCTFVENYAGKSIVYVCIELHSIWSLQL